MARENSFNRGAYHIANNKVEYNPQRKDNFTLVVTGIDDLLRVGSRDGSTDSKDKMTDGQEQIMLALKSCGTPQFSQGEIPINRGNSVIKFAGKPTFSDISFSAYDYIGSNIKDILLAWQQLSYNSKYDYVGNAKSYKKNCQLLQLTPDGTLVRYWDIKGAWLKDVKPGDFDYSSDDAQTVDATLVYDWAELRMPDDYTV